MDMDMDMDMDMGMSTTTSTSKLTAKQSPAKDQSWPLARKMKAASSIELIDIRNCECILPFNERDWNAVRGFNIKCTN